MDQGNPGRIKSIHLKDWGKGEGRGYAVAFGEGDVPWKGLLQAAESTGGVEYHLIEQEHAGADGEMAMAKRCLDNYKKLRGRPGCERSRRQLPTPNSQLPNGVVRTSGVKDVTNQTGCGAFPLWARRSAFERLGVGRWELTQIPSPACASALSASPVIDRWSTHQSVGRRALDRTG